MADSQSFCRCGKKVDPGHYGFCDSCADKWRREEERIREYVERHELSYSDQQELIQKASDRCGSGYTIRYCTYRGSCGNVIENGADFCPSCIDRQRQYEQDEERRRRKAVDDY